MRRPQGMTLAEAFAWHPKGTAQPLVAGIKGECITWNAARVGSGYGQFRFEGRHVTAHVVAYSLANGPVPTTPADPRLPRVPRAPEPAVGAADRRPAAGVGHVVTRTTRP